jgi:FkbM family methyltransferase
MKYTPQRIARAISRRVKKALAGEPDGFLKHCHGVVHVGANDGAERDLYARYGLPVLWVEASPEVYQTLTANLSGYSNQCAVNALVTDKEDETYDFHVAGNAGHSSSIYEFQDHKEIWPDIDFTETIPLRSKTLAHILEEAGDFADNFEALVLDVQGAELLVINGAEERLNGIRFIKAEAADFEAYQGACTLDTLTAALEAKGFALRRKEPFIAKEGVGTYYDVLFERKA